MKWRTLSAGLGCCMMVSWGNPAPARDLAALTFVTRTADAAEAHVLDIRALELCSVSSLPQARCLPVDNFVNPTGGTIGFHALRWLLGTVGLSGKEQVLLIGSKSQDVQAVGALLYLAGQKQVTMLDVPFEPQVDASRVTFRGEARSISRETVFTTAMRDALLVTPDQRTASTHINLAQFAAAAGHGDTQARFAPGTNE